VNLKQKLTIWLALILFFFGIPNLLAGKVKSFLAWTILIFLWAVVMIFYFSIQEDPLDYAFLPKVVVGLAVALILAFIILIVIL